MSVPSNNLLSNQQLEEPPDLTSMQIDGKLINHKAASFLQTLLANKCISTSINNHSQPLPNPDLSDEFINDKDEDDTFIPISTTDKARLYEPWKYSVIIKLFGRRIAHHLLQTKLIELWKPTEEFPIIDLGSDFFLIKFQQEDNMLKALQSGPWFILNHFLSVRRWEPKFIASSTQLTYSAIWVRLPKLPTEFYDVEILQRVGSKLGQLLKIDTCTSTTTKGRYARICIEVPLERPLKTHINIGNHKQILLYEGINVLYTNCGHLGHIIQNCPTSKKTIPIPITNQPSTSAKPEPEWKTVVFSKRFNSSYKQRQNSRPTNTRLLEQTSAHLLRANGLVGGLLVFWNEATINVTEMRLSQQEIHCVVQVPPPPT
ncbi:uncharacterized protein LOC142182352 isoform X2 [Nicotiana tabacum]|uniref:Uncharacterized protein LOC142182352 isoform X2 n=1 Tax=Nicotiana tabacum TaxID=4097 RepID=A0AC58UTJ3_TOBAC